MARVPNAFEGVATMSLLAVSCGIGLRVLERGHASGAIRQPYRTIAADGLDVEPGIGQTTLVGEIRDQSHLYGVLDRVRGLGLDLVSVERNWGTPELGDEESAR